jgi:hypothetical protein
MKNKWNIVGLENKRKQQNFPDMISAHRFFSSVLKLFAYACLDNF